jgi:acyl carrier protein
LSRSDAAVSRSAEALDQVRGALVTVLSVDPAALTWNTPLADVGADSLALIELADILEEVLPGLVVEDEALEAFVTVGDAADYLAARR